MGDAQTERRLGPTVLKQIMEEEKLNPASLARRLCWVEYWRGDTTATETWQDFRERREDAARKLVARKIDVESEISGTKPATADNLALALALEPSVRPGEAKWEEAERQAEDHLERMTDCARKLVPPGPRLDPAAKLLRALVKQARAVADRVRGYVDSEGAHLNELLRAGTPQTAHSLPQLARLWEVLKHSEVGRTDVKQIDDAARAARRELDDIMAARRRYEAERHASASLCATQGFTSDTMQQYAADCRIDAEYADALGRSDEAARVRDFAKRYEAYGRLLGAMEPLKETIESSINRDVQHTDALHGRLEAAFMASAGKTALALKQADRVRQKPRTDRGEGATDGDV